MTTAEPGEREDERESPRLSERDLRHLLDFGGARMAAPDEAGGCLGERRTRRRRCRQNSSCGSRCNGTPLSFVAHGHEIFSVEQRRSSALAPAVAVPKNCGALRCFEVLLAIIDAYAQDALNHNVVQVCPPRPPLFSFTSGFLSRSNFALRIRVSNRDDPGCRCKREVRRDVAVWVETVAKQNLHVRACCDKSPLL